MMFILLLALVGCAVNAQDESVFDAEGDSVCSAYGGRHIITFDGVYYHFQGKGTYTLFQDCQTTDPNFQVLINQTYYCDSKQTKCKISLKISTNGFIIHILPGGIVTQDNKRIYMPFQIGELELRKIANYIVIKGIKGVVIHFDGSSSVYMFASPEMMGQLCGLCGFFDGNKTNDFVNYVKKPINNKFDFSNAWLDPMEPRNIPGVEEDKIHPCLKLRNSNPKRANHVQTTCSILKADYVSFQKCHSAVDPDAFLAMCNRDMCSCLLSKGVEECNHLSCDAAQQYARACNKHSVHINWRSNTYCPPPKCPLNMEFKECSRNCRRSCGTDSFETECEDFCVDGCFCKNGTLWDYATSSCVLRSLCSCYQADKSFPPETNIDVGSETCVCSEGTWDCKDLDLKVDGSVKLDKSSQCLLPEQCPCKHNGMKYKDGEKFWKDCNLCYCDHGTWVCTERNCEATCSSFGDPHYVTFDGRAYNFEGTCGYIVAQDFCNETGGTFQVTAENVPCGTLGYSCTKSVKFLIYDTVIHLNRETNITFTANTHAPTGSAAANYTIKELGSYIIIIAHGITVKWDNGMKLSITLQPKYMGRVCGLCGNFDRLPYNDFRDKNFFPENSQSPLAFANSWRLRDTCATVERESPSPCLLNPHREAWANSSCKIILGKTFEPCHSSVDPQWYYEACRDDTCACDRGGDFQCFCTAVAAYAERCLRAGACVDWREDKNFGTEDICPMQCLPSRDYFPCYTSCPKSCSDLSNPEFTCNTEDIEGCFCPEGTYLQDDDCVPSDQCYCTDLETGKTYKPGTVLMLDCRECNCYKGVFRCPEGPKCVETTQFPATTEALASTTKITSRNSTLLPTTQPATPGRYSTTIK